MTLARSGPIKDRLAASGIEAQDEIVRQHKQLVVLHETAEGRDGQTQQDRQHEDRDEELDQGEPGERQRSGLRFAFHDEFRGAAVWTEVVH